MFWQTEAEPGVRQIGVGGKSVPVPYHLIVDGQQRLTSLYAVTTGKPVVREDFTEARIKIAFNPFTEVFAVPDATTEKQVEWLADITPLFEDFLDTVEGYTERLEQVRGDLTKQERKHLFAVFDRVRDLVGYQFSVVELDASAEEEQVAEVFVRINSEGVVLNQADFILTLMSVYWEKGRRELEDFAGRPRPRRCPRPARSTGTSNPSQPRCCGSPPSWRFGGRSSSTSTRRCGARTSRPARATRPAGRLSSSGLNRPRIRCWT
jgi:hypothetical protein